jgi:hypothetical protein
MAWAKLLNRERMVGQPTPEAHMPFTLLRVDMGLNLPARCADWANVLARTAEQ